ncbi:hypothetical protein [Streptomyces lasiicapitis]|uniref:hypothetical protein n=1 Tax=Streptomyces lasiicapitis TaxID=1923961 RepID=UPI0036762F52
MTEYIPAGAPRAAESRVAFTLRTNPEVVRVSPGTGDAEYAGVTVVGSVTGEEKITLNKVTVKILKGADSPHFASSLDGVEVSVDRSGWTYVGVQQSTFSFLHSSGGEMVDPGASLTVRLDRIPVNQAIGSSQVTVTAHWNNESGTGRTIFEIGKFPPGFYLRDFTSSHAEVNNGEDVELRWQASADATLHLMYEDAQYDVTGRSEFTVSDMRRTTVFYLRGSHGSAEQTLGTIVGVSDPDIEVNNLVVTGAVRADRLESRTLERIRIVPPSTEAAAAQPGQLPPETVAQLPVAEEA